MNHIKVFIASTREHLDYARAIENRLEHDFITNLWDTIFKASEYPLESLSNQLENSDFGVFVLTPADITISREQEYNSPRDNIIFELGMFIGELGRKRTFLIVPRGVRNFKMPSDLSGLTYLTYDENNESLESALGTACNQVRNSIRETGPRKKEFFYQCKLFSELHSDFEKLITNAKNISLHFVHSRRWRENHDHDMVKFLKKPNTTLRVFLPDLNDDILIKALEKRFDDGEFVRSFISDAYRYFGELKENYQDRIKIYSYPNYPTYSFYKFDNQIVISLYPSSSKRKPSPSFFIDEKTIGGDFLTQDLSDLLKESKELDLQQFRQKKRS